MTLLECLKEVYPIHLGHPIIAYNDIVLFTAVDFFQSFSGVEMGLNRILVRERRG